MILVPVPVEARRDVAAATLALAVRRVVDAAPPLSPSQRDMLAILLRGGCSGRPALGSSLRLRGGTRL